ncbi:MAG: hypothetical protein R3E01_25895 [Pirellulaceae bacterium]
MIISPAGSSEILDSGQRQQLVAKERIVYVAPDWTDSAVKKRAHGFLSLGHDLICFSFRRDRYYVGSQCGWRNIELGRSEERRLWKRIATCIQAATTFLRHGKELRQATVIYARNLDLALLALCIKTLSRSRAVLVYEVLDVHPLLASEGFGGKLARWLERMVLQRCRILVVSSPAYLREYFIPRQKFQGHAYVLENKWPGEGAFAPERRPRTRPLVKEPVWTIGWLGNIRCPRSLELLKQVADMLPSHARIVLRGCTSLLERRALETALRGRHNLIFGGEYIAPDDLAEIYAQIHFNWCADFSDGPNSQWLIPNRVYEGGFFGVPALAVEGSETATLVQKRQLGVVLPDAEPATLYRLLTKMDLDQYRCLQQRLQQQPIASFIDEGQLQELIERATTPR